MRLVKTTTTTSTRGGPHDFTASMQATSSKRRLISRACTCSARWPGSACFRDDGVHRPGVYPQFARCLGGIEAVKLGIGTRQQLIRKAWNDCDEQSSSGLVTTTKSTATSAGWRGSLYGISVRCRLTTWRCANAMVASSEKRSAEITDRARCQRGADDRWRLRPTQDASPKVGRTPNEAQPFMHRSTRNNDYRTAGDSDEQAHVVWVAS